MTKTRLHGLYLLLIGTIVFVLFSLALVSTSESAMQDFAVMYFPARCLIQHRDPYSGSEVLRTGQAENVNRHLTTNTSRYDYLPTAFFFTIPFAILPWGPAHIIWMTFTLMGLIIASILIWDLGADYAPIVCGTLLGFLLANSEVIVLGCNSAGIAVSFCVVAVWCFLRDRFVSLGILSFAISLAVKPQDAGLVWLFFLLAGPVYRKRALQTLLAMAILSLPAVLWVTLVSPHWMQEWHSNLLTFAEPGGINDPGLVSSYSHGGAMVISLQSVVSAIWENPHIYNPVSYLVFAPLLLAWTIATLRSRSSPRRDWLAVAAITPLSMISVYHHLYDTKLLLLTIPACTMLWAKGGLTGWLALAVNAAGFAFTGDLSLSVFFECLKHLHLASMGLPKQIQMAAQVFPAPLSLLAMGVFYLYVYIRHSSTRFEALLEPAVHPAQAYQS